MSLLNGAIPGLSRVLADAITHRPTAVVALKAVFDGTKTSVKGHYCGQTSTQYKVISGMKW